jgi:membrane protease YdiL (CAAX protease family)
MNNHKFPSALEALIVSIGIVMSFHLFSLILIVILQFTLTGYSIEDFSRIIFIVGGIYFLFVTVVYLKIRNFPILETLRLKSVSAETAILGAVIGLTAGILTDEIDVLRQMLIENPQWFEEMMQYFSASSAFDWVLLITGVVVLASLSEEFLFRGFLQLALEKHGDVTRAVLLTSLAWTMVHLNIFWALQTFIIGVIIGFLVWKCGSIVPAIIAHAINNFFSLLYHNYEASLGWYRMGDHVSLIVLAIALPVFLWGMRRFITINS